MSRSAQREGSLVSAMQRGAALILAMLVAALAATVAVALAGAQQRWLADVGSRRDQVQAQSLAVRGLDPRLFFQPGAAREAVRLVPDLEVRVDAALRNR